MTPGQVQQITLYNCKRLLPPMRHSTDRHMTCDTGNVHAKSEVYSCPLQMLSWSSISVDWVYHGRVSWDIVRVKFSCFSVWGSSMCLEANPRNLAWMCHTPSHSILALTRKKLPPFCSPQRAGLSILNKPEAWHASFEPFERSCNALDFICRRN